MDNKEKILEWTNRYFAVSGAERTLWGFEHDGIIYAFYPAKEAIVERTRISRTSTKKGSLEKLRLKKLTSVQRQALIIGGQAEIVCTSEYLKNEAKSYNLNIGQAFEQVISLINDQGCYKKGDRRGFWECGDVVIDGLQVQVKFEDASLTELRTIEKAEAIKR